MAQNIDTVDEELYDEDDEDTIKDRYFTFRVGEEEYGIEIVVFSLGLQQI